MEQKVRYAIVDIETTGSKILQDAITEIAIVRSDGSEVIDMYHTLVNPMREIPAFITALTGIDNKMLEGQPVFEEVAEEIASFLQDHVFVAHNVGFDYGFVKSSLAQAGIDFREKRLCTVRLARKIMPGLPSYGLGRLCNQLNIEIKHRHRAHGDAMATAHLFHKIVSADGTNHINEAMNKNSREAIMPPNLPKRVFNSLPLLPGVYYFEDEKGNVLYVGKAKNIRQRVYNHLITGLNKKSLTGLKHRIANISYELTGTELIAYLLESYEIKRIRPPFNRAQRLSMQNFGLISYTDSRGYSRFAIDRISANQQLLASFQSLTDARDFVYKIAGKFDLCHKLAGLQIANGSCNEYKLGLCSGACVNEENITAYNEKHRNAIRFISQSDADLLLIGQGREESEISLVGFQRGRFIGFGYTAAENRITSMEDAIDHLKPFPDNTDIQRIIRSYLQKPQPEKIVRF